MKAAVLLTSLLLAFSMFAQRPPRGDEGKIHTLPKEKAAKTISLNPEYHVLGEELAKDGKKLPLLILLHGGGGVGSDINRIKRRGMGLLPVMAKAGIETLLVAPQASLNPMKVGAKGGWQASDLNILIEHLLSTLPIDPDRVYLTGNSMGGYGTYAWAGVNPEHFAAIAPVSARFAVGATSW